MTIESLTASLADRYRVERELGQGGMATVYLAEDVKHHRQVAVKVLREDLAASMGSGRFLREIEIAARLQHPHILPLLDSGEADGFLYYVMPFVKGESLRQRLTREGELPVHEAVRLIIEVVDALTLAHEHGVVHRDIKPDNIMLSGRHALVMDFGVAKAISEATGRNTVTTLGVAVGTPAYMSPEQAAADPHVDARTDIYAVGVMLYEMLTGQPPFVRNTPQQVLAAQVTETPEAVTKRRPAIPAALDAIVMRCLAKRPADRFQSAAELHAALEPLATSSIGMTPTSTRPVALPLLRNRVALWAGVGVVALVAAAAVFLAFSRREHQASAPFSYDRVRLTISGAASSPAISSDGKQVAYGAHECDEKGRCVYQVVVADIAAGTSQVIVDSLAWASPDRWSANAAWLLVRARAESRGLPNGLYVVSHLGGSMKLLGSIGDFVPHGDTALVSLDDGPRARVYLHTFVPPWSQPVDSIAVGRPDSASDLVDVRLSPNGRWIAVLWLAGGRERSNVLSIHDRTGASVSHSWFDLGDQIRWTGESSGIVATGLLGSEGTLLERVDIDPRTGRINPRDGKLDWTAIARPGEIVLAESNSAAVFDVSLDGTVLVYDATRQGDEIVWALDQVASGASYSHRDRHLRRVESADRFMLTPDGRTIVYRVENPLARGRQGQWFAAPFDGGAERAITPMLTEEFARTVTTDSRTLVVAEYLQGGQSRVTSYQIADGRATVLASRPAAAGYWLWPAGEDGVAMVEYNGRSFDILQDPGDNMRRLPYPDSVGSVRVLAASPSGDGWIVSATPHRGAAQGESDGNSPMTLFRVSATGTWTVVANTRLLGRWEGAHWTTNGTFQLISGEAADPRAAMYSVPVTGGVLKRGELVPYPSCTCTFSADGRRGLAAFSKSLSDIWMIRNFGPSKQ